jgi:hypothetical protein
MAIATTQVGSVFIINELPETQLTIALLRSSNKCGEAGHGGTEKQDRRSLYLSPKKLGIGLGEQNLYVATMSFEQFVQR